MAMGRDLLQLSFVGMVGMWDPPRVGVERAVSVLQESAVAVKMITGDSRETGQAIGTYIHACVCGMATPLISDGVIPATRRVVERMQDIEWRASAQVLKLV